LHGVDADPPATASVSPVHPVASRTRLRLRQSPLAKRSLIRCRYGWTSVLSPNSCPVIEVKDGRLVCEVLARQSLASADLGNRRRRGFDQDNRKKQRARPRDRTLRTDQQTDGWLHFVWPTRLV